MSDQQKPFWSEAQKESLGEYVREAMEASHVPGAAVIMVTRDGTVLYKEAFGHISADTKSQCVEPGTPLMIGSCTKPLVSLLAAKQVEKGKFTWRTPVKQILKPFQLSSPELTESITMEHFLSGSSGLSRFDWNITLSLKGPDEHLKDMSMLTADHPPMAVFGYNNMAVTAAGYAASCSSGQTSGFADTFARQMSQEIFDPLGMQNTFFGCSKAPSSAARPCVPDYAAAGCPALEMETETWADNVAPAGAAWSTVDDLAKYLVMEMNNGMLPSGERFIDEAVLLERRKRRITFTPIKFGSISFLDNSEYGLCLIEKRLNGKTLYSHGGYTLGFSADMAFIPEVGIAYAVVSNLGNAFMFTDAVGVKVLQTIFPSAGFDTELAVRQCAEVLTVFSSMCSVASYDREAVYEAVKPWIDAGKTSLSNPILGKFKILKDDQLGATLVVGDSPTKFGVIKGNGKITLLPTKPFLLVGSRFDLHPSDLGISTVYEGHPYTFN